MDWVTLTSDKSVAGSIANWFNNATVQAQAATIIEEAEDWIYQSLRHWKMLSVPIYGTFAEGQDTISIPDDCLEIRSFWLTQNYSAKLIMKTEDLVISQFLWDGDGNRVQTTPSIYYMNGSYFQFDSPADQEYPYLYTYYQRPAALSQSNSTNFLTTFGARLLRATISMMACEWTKEVGSGQFDRTYWEQKALQQLDQFQTSSDLMKRSIISGPNSFEIDQ